ncbi:MAG: glucose-6-phosphate isomerase [Bdellovibrionaceae bacterium]|nr:glucose-6-phosphate isomerase [Bdellovibrio sp.]
MSNEPIAAKVDSLSFINCPDEVAIKITELDSQDYCRRIWGKDASLWKSDPTEQIMIEKSLGWLVVIGEMQEALTKIDQFVQNIKKSGFSHVVHLGMGGSSLAALVFARTFDLRDGLPLTVLDTTDPITIKKIADSVPLAKTLFIVASKSGTTGETLALKDYFYERLKFLKGDQAGENFVAITDANNVLVQMAQNEKFRQVFLNQSDIGGRYSALTYFGLVPAALMGIDVSEILKRAMKFAEATRANVEGPPSAAFTLGAVLGEMARHKKNKVTFIVEKPLETFGLWVEQLIAESTGKDGTGIIPITNEPLGKPSDYGNDRLFIYLTLEVVSKNSNDEKLKNFVLALSEAGQPIVTIKMKDLFDLGQEFFRWEFAAALAGAILGINAFDQPNVQKNKDITNQILSEKLVQENPTFTEGSLSIYSTENLRPFLLNTHPGDYLALMAFLPESPTTTEWLQRIRASMQDKLRLATTLGYGPRFLHSTGQLHKGGPSNGLFIQLTADYIPDISIPFRKYTFGDFITAQAQGDLQVLRANQRRALRIHLGSDVESGLKELLELVSKLNQ